MLSICVYDYRLTTYFASVDELAQNHQQCVNLEQPLQTMWASFRMRMFLIVFTWPRVLRCVLYEIL